MYFATFQTPCPLSDVQRALDELARAGFELRGLDMAPQEPGAPGAQIRIHYAGTARISPETYLQRLARMSEVSRVQGGVLPDAAAGRLALRQGA
jgi:hypothetical protein